VANNSIEVVEVFVAAVIVPVNINIRPKVESCQRKFNNIVQFGARIVVKHEADGMKKILLRPTKQHYNEELLLTV